VRNVMNTVLIALVSAALVAAPVLAAPSPASTPSAPLGIVVQADNSHVGTDRTYSGETIYDGDRLETPQGSTMRLQFGAEQMIMRQGSSAQLHAIPNGFSANLAGGSVVVSSAAGQTFELYADGATVRPATADPVSGQITVISPKELVLTSTHGVLKVTMGDEVKTVETGSSYRMELESDDSGASPQQSPSPTARNRIIWIIIPAVAAVTGIVIWRALVSPSS
jgi:hypothetical protein